MVSPHARLIIAVGLSSALSCHALHAQAPASPPASFDVMDATIDRIHAALKSGSLSCVALVENYLARIKAYDQAGPKLNAIQNVNPAAIVMAGEFDAKLKSGDPIGRLHCIPVLVKDQIETDFMPTTYGSALFKAFVPARNAHDRRKDAGRGRDHSRQDQSRRVRCRRSWFGLWRLPQRL